MTSRSRYFPEYRTEALALADKIGISAAARQLGHPESQLYGWRSKQRKDQEQSAVDQ